MIKQQIFVLFMLTSIMVVGQRGNSSPYSFFGLGEKINSVTAEQASMGQIGVAFKSNSYLNFINPAANADLRLATYGLGGLMTSLSLNEADNKQSGTAISLSYISLGFPIGNKAGLSVGLQPQSSVGYAFLDEVNDVNGNTISFTRFTGSGGTSKLFASFGIYVFKGFSLGVEAAYVFGSIENSILAQGQVQLATINTESVKVRGGAYKIGAQYQTALKDKLQLNLGLSFHLDNQLSVSGNNVLYSSSLATGTPKDVLSDKAISGNFTTPLKTIMGIGIGKESKWYAGINYEYQDAFKNESQLANLDNKYKYEKSNKFSVGGFYLPKINSISSYWNRVTYRAGLRFEKTGLLVDGTGLGNNFNSIDDFGISFGLGLPIGNQLSNLNFGVEYGKKGTTANNLIQENYFNFRLSLSLNDIWFQKRKID